MGAGSNMQGSPCRWGCAGKARETPGCVTVTGHRWEQPAPGGREGPELCLDQPLQPPGAEEKGLKAPLNAAALKFITFANCLGVSGSAARGIRVKDSSASLCRGAGEGARTPAPATKPGVPGVPVPGWGHRGLVPPPEAAGPCWALELPCDHSPGPPQAVKWLRRQRHGRYSTGGSHSCLVTNKLLWSSEHEHGCCGIN